MILLETRLYRFFFDRIKPSNMSSATFEGGAACYKCKNIQGTWELVILICILLPKITSASTNLGLQTSRAYHIIHPCQWNFDKIPKKFRIEFPSTRYPSAKIASPNLNQNSAKSDENTDFESVVVIAQPNVQQCFNQFMCHNTNLNTQPLKEALT
jgi:hypothetical protein